MAVLELPVRADFNSYFFQLDLEGSTFTFTFSFNIRSQRWSMDIGDADGNPIVEGIRIVTNIVLNLQFIARKIPPGFLMLIDETGGERIPTENDLGEDLKLVYLEAG